MAEIQLELVTPSRRVLTEEVSETVLVVGGGRAGLDAALTAAGVGHPVVLIDEADETVESDEIAWADPARN